MSIHVGSLVVVHARDKVISGKVLAVTPTHARCALDDGRTLWVANELVQPAPTPTEATAVSSTAAAPSEPAPLQPSTAASSAAPPAPTDWLHPSTASPTDLAASASPPPPRTSSAPFSIAHIVAIYIGCLVAFAQLLKWTQSVLVPLLLIIPLWYLRSSWGAHFPVRAKQWWKHGLIAYLSCVGLLVFGFTQGFVRHLQRHAQGRPPVTAPSEQPGQRQEASLAYVSDGSVPDQEPDGEVAKVRKELATLRQLEVEHPNTAQLAAQLAQALLDVGLGESAREEARRAVRIDPQSALAHDVLGETLRHDLVGRLLKPGADRAGAEAELRKAVTLDPTRINAISAMAVMWEYDDDGWHTFPAAQLERARALHEEYQARATKRQNLDVNYLHVLLDLGRYGEVIEKCPKLLDIVQTRAYSLAAVALSQGTAHAVRELSTIVPNEGDRGEALRQAGELAKRVRRYPEAVALLSEAAKLHADAEAIRREVEDLRPMRRRETMRFDEREPRQVVKAYMTSSLDAKGDPCQVVPQGTHVEHLQERVRGYGRLSRRGD